MHTTTITDNLIQLTRLGFINAYLVREEDGFTLVDTTLKAADEIVSVAREAGSEIQRIVLTHGHGDHVGSLDALRERLGPQVPVLLPELDARILAGETVVESKPPGSWPKVRTRPDGHLEAGQRIGSLEVIPTPGHTPGHVSFLDTRDRSVIVGDVVTTWGGRTEVTNHFNPRFPLASPATWNGQQDLESARTLRSLDPVLLAPGHGGAERDPLAALDGAISRGGG